MLDVTWLEEIIFSYRNKTICMHIEKVDCESSQKSWIESNKYTGIVSVDLSEQYAKPKGILIRDAPSSPKSEGKPSYFLQ